MEVLNNPRGSKGLARDPITARLFFDDYEEGRHSKNIRSYSMNGWTKLSPIVWSKQSAVIEFFADIGISKRHLRNKSGNWTVGLLLEPRSWTPGPYRAAQVLSEHFDIILTYDDLLLRQGLPFAPYIPGGIQLKPDEKLILTSKTEFASISASKKKAMEGHRLRHKIVAQLSDVGLHAMGGGYAPYDHPSEPYNRFKFSVVVENTRDANNVTEKLLHAYLYKCIPIYWGGSVADDYFLNLIRFNDVQDLRTILSNLDKNYYDKHLHQVEENFKRAQKLVSKELNILNALKGFSKIPSELLEFDYPTIRVGHQIEPGRSAPSLQVNLSFSDRIRRYWLYKMRYFWHPVVILRSLVKHFGWRSNAS